MFSQSLIWFLLSNAVSFRRDKAISNSRVLLHIIYYSSVLILNTPAFIISTGLYGGLLHTTPITLIFQNFLYTLCIIIVLIIAFYPRKFWSEDFASLAKLLLYSFLYTVKRILNKTAQQFRIVEYSLITMFAILGGALLLNSHDFVSMFLSLELQSYGFYIISAIFRNSELSSSAGLTYFLLGSLSSCFILLGSSLLYISYGSTFMECLYIVTDISDSSPDISNSTETNQIYRYKLYFIHTALLVLSVGLLFKISGAPFHFWSPDVYDAIPTTTTTFLAIIGKIAIFILLLQLVHFTGKSLFFYSNYSWKTSLIISSLLSLIIGTLAGLTQYRIKRLYAYSTISHIGYILLALSINSIESIQAFIFYILQYSISNLNAFMLLLCIGFSFYYLIDNKKYKDIEHTNHKQLQEINNSPVQYISQLKGYFYINPILALSLTITLFSFIGIPPLIGFFGKQMVLSAALDSGYIFLALIAILTSVISAVYYLVVIKQMFFFKPAYNNLDIKKLKLFGYITNNFAVSSNKKVWLTTIVLSSSLTIIISILTLVILFFILIPQESIDMTNVLALSIFNH